MKKQTTLWQINTEETQNGEKRKCQPELFLNSTYYKMNIHILHIIRKNNKKRKINNLHWMKKKDKHTIFVFCGCRASWGEKEKNAHKLGKIKLKCFLKLVIVYDLSTVGIWLYSFRQLLEKLWVKITEICFEITKTDLLWVSNLFINVFSFFLKVNRLTAGPNYDRGNQ